MLAFNSYCFNFLYALLFIKLPNIRKQQTFLGDFEQFQGNKVNEG